MKLKKMLVLGFSVMVTGVVVLTGLLVLQEQIQSELFKVINRRQVSILLADELRQSSDDLTRMARTYVVTADPKYEKMYWDILAIRNGDKPRPEEYDRVYWDLVLTYGDKPRPNGKAIPLQQLMKEAGFTSEEFALLKEAQNNSDALVYTETIAMNAMKGLYEDKNGNFVKKGDPDYEMARRIMHDEKYHKDKYIIMEPIDRFLAEVKARTAQEVKDIENTEIAIHRVTLMLAGFAIILFIGVGYYVIRKTWAILGCEPSVFAEMAKRVTAGDLSFSMEDISSELKEGHKSGILSEAVSTMLEALKEQTKEINSTLASAANELSTTASQLAASTTETSSTINHVGGTVEEVRHIAQLANDRTSKVMEDAHSLRRVSVHGSTASQDAIDSMKLINTEMEKIAETIIHLSEQTQNIGEIVDAVNDIADQSNLLSINASIEASKAGEYGKGFAVVAQEMKELTEQSKVATAKIAAILGEIQQATGSAVMATERGGKAVNSGKELVSKAGLSIDELADGMEKSVQSVEQIGASSKEQLVGMDQLVDAIEDIKSATSQNVEGTTQLESAAIKLRNLVEQLGKKTDKANK